MKSRDGRLEQSPKSTPTPVLTGVDTNADFLRKIKQARQMYPNAKKICQKCFTPIYEIGGECPNCEN